MNTIDVGRNHFVADRNCFGVRNAGQPTEVIASAFLMGSLAMGVAPVQAALHVCLLWIALLANTAWVDQTWKLMDDRPQTQYIHMSIAALFAGLFYLSPR